ncbi:hypothetical protein ACLKMH_05925 [Psychromonas sp. KJ10-10]|uniref:hypothetical protein n=1 Tax=Psychromonas sp. KJ10-10 TaxID=3391823 RepID=UPI0039B5688D
MTKYSDNTLTKENILVLIDNAEKMQFFYKLIINNNIKNVSFLHSNYYTFRQCKKYSFLVKSILLKKEKDIPINQKLSIEEAKNKQLYNHSIKLEQKKIIESLSYNSSQIWIFSGFQYSYLSIQNFLDKNKILFFEIGNFPNKYQSSKSGVNADSDYNHRVKRLRENKSIEKHEIDELIEELFNFRPPM